MKKLEDFIRDHRDEFDSSIPSLDLWDKIEGKIEKKRGRTINLWKGAAAVAAVLVLAFVSTYFLKNQGNEVRYANVSDPQVKELIETEAYYSEKVSSKMTEIHNCYKIYPELKGDIETDLNELDTLYKELENDLKENLYNREVIEAMIQNNRLRLELVDRVLDQINC